MLYVNYFVYIYTIVNQNTITMLNTVYQVSIGGIIEFETLDYQEVKNRMKLLTTMGYEYKFSYRGRDESEY